MELEGSQNCVGRETELQWKGVKQLLVDASIMVPFPRFSLTPTNTHPKLCCGCEENVDFPQNVHRMQRYMY